MQKAPNNSQNDYKYTAIFGQLVICIVGNWTEKLTCAKHNKKTYFDPFHSNPFTFFHKSNMQVNFYMLKNYIKANTCLFSWGFLLSKLFIFQNKKVKMVDNFTRKNLSGVSANQIHCTRQKIMSC